jgi:hypothetical protein
MGAWERARDAIFMPYKNEHPNCSKMFGTIFALYRFLEVFGDSSRFLDGMEVAA